MKSDERLDRLFAAAREHQPDSSVLEYGFETRVLARIREERSGAWFSWAWRMCPYFAALAAAAGAWAYLHADGMPDTESVAATLRSGGMPVLEYYLGREE
jgi:hypothetical protein